MTDRENETMTGESLLRLLHLVSPSLPTGGFAYSQGLEWAVEADWITDGDGLSSWIAGVLTQSIIHVDIPVFSRMYDAGTRGDTKKMAYWSDMLLACRETRELRLEEISRGRALASLLEGIELPEIGKWSDIVARSQLAGFALASARWRIPPREAALGYVWSWLENQVMAGVKIIPLGQTEGQRILCRLHRQVPPAVDRGLLLEDDAIGSSMPALAIGSSLHETQYTRLFRS